MMTSKKIQVTHVDKGDDKIIITQQHVAPLQAPMTCSNMKSTNAPTTKLVSEHTRLL